ncbi:MAG TPA: FtsX-like permease family protein [Bacteroidales bacterium]|nr:FtsX-like permease family protein [Bacteroidales bacterium]
MRLSVYIARRYLLAKKSRNVINIISGVSVAGVAVGTMALIIILSVFNGLEEMVNRIFNTFDPELKITAIQGKVFDADSSKLLKLTKLDGIECWSGTLEENALLMYEKKQFIGTVKGVDDNYARVTGIDSSMADNDKFSLWSTGMRPQAIVGAGVAHNLGLNVNFIEQLQVWVPKRTGSVNLNPEEAFIKRYISPSGVFRVEHEYDSRYIYVPLQFTRDLLEYDDQLSSIEIKTRPGLDINRLKHEVAKIFGPAFEVRDRLEQQEIFYKVMRSERLAIFIILTLILLIASFNIIGSLTMLIIEKERDIEILRSLGADNVLIRRIFIIEGWLISITGAVAGLLLGLIICWAQQRFGLIKLNSETLMMQSYPVVMKIKDFIAVPVTVLLIGYWAAWYPVRFLTRKYLLKN